MKVVPESIKGRGILKPDAIPVRLSSSGSNNLLCGKCGKVVVVNLPDIDMVSDTGPALIICADCKAYNEIPPLSKPA